MEGRQFLPHRISISCNRGRTRKCPITGVPWHLHNIMKATMSNTTHLLDIQKPLLLDGGMGRELKFRGVPISKAIWAANGLLVAPEVVTQVHADYIRAGADIITTNTYGLIRSDLAKIYREDSFAELNQLACELAVEARSNCKRDVLIAGSLPPLAGSFRPDLVASFDEIEPLYHEQAELLAPYVDILLCETMSTVDEARAAAHAACRTGKPVWVAWTLHEDRSGALRSGESVTEAIKALEDLPVSGLLVNCCAPESVSAAMVELKASGAGRIGGYANAFEAIPEDWTLEGSSASDGLLPLRNDLGPEDYVDHARIWLEGGANLIGGCCGTRPSHIRRLRQLLDESCSK